MAVPSAASEPREQRMLTFSGFRTHACLAGVAIAIVLPIRLVLGTHYAEQRRALHARASKERTRELARHWNSFAYTNAMGSVLAEVVVTRINWTSLQLTEIQQTKLKSRLREVFGYLGNPTFEEYYRLKTEGLTCRLELNGPARNLLARRAARTNYIDGQEIEWTLRTLWEAAFPTNGAAGPGTIVGISLDRVRATTSVTNSHTSILSGKTANGLSIVLEAMEPGFCYGGRTNAVSSDSAHGLFAHLSFFARSSASNDAGPVYLSLCWSECDQEWALSRLFTDGVLKFRMVF